MATETLIYPRYSCPHCGVSLEARIDRWQGWVSCPSCGGAGLPPERVRIRTRERRRHESSGQLPPEAKAIERNHGLSHEPTAWVPASPPRQPSSPASSAPRLIASTGLFVSAFLMLVAYLDRSTHNLAIFGCLTVISLLALLRIRSRSRG